MDQKQLDFNAPLLSVRRFTSAAAASKIEENKKVQNSKKPSLTSYKPELKSGPVRNPGAVPFLWEQSPGTPKGGSSLLPKGPELPPLVPKLPPGRTVDFNSPSSVKNIDEKEVADMKVVKPPWNGRLTSFPGGFSSNGNINTLERSKRNDKKEQTVDSDNSDDCNSDAFSDAQDTLSHSDSLFMNCSVSVLSASEGSGLKHSRRTLTDPQARDFMMDRFLPAAKAMASETPQYASRKQPVARQMLNSRHIGNADVDRRPRLLGENKPPLHLQYKPYVKPVVQNVVGEYSDDDDDDDGDDDGTDNLTAKACGILPRFCLKSSMFLLNPVPGLRIRRRLPMSSVGHKVSTNVKTSSPEYLSEPDPETWEAVYRHKLTRGLQFPGTYDNGSKPTSESNQLTWWSDSQTPDGSSPLRRSTGEGISPFQNGASHSSLHGGMGFLGVPIQSKNFKADTFVTHSNSIYDDGGVLSYQSSKRGSGSSSPAIEKTLYVDSVRMLESSTSRCSSSDIKELMITPEKNSELLVETKRFNKVLTLQGHFGEANHLKGFGEREALQLKASDCVESNPLSSSEESILGVCINSDKVFGVNDGGQETKLLDCSEALDDKSPNCNTSEPLKVDQEIVCANSILPLPPPLPKSPSESWLCRTLPSVTSMNTFSRSYLGVQCRPKKQPQKASIADPKWETIVKTTNVHGHVRFSEATPFTFQHQ